MEKEYNYKQQSPIHPLPKGRGLLGYEVKYDRFWVNPVKPRVWKFANNGKMSKELTNYVKVR